MIYSDYDFLLLFPAVALIFFNLRSAISQNVFLVLFGLVFLAWHNVWNLLPVMIVLALVPLFFWIKQRFNLPRPTLQTQALITLLVLNLIYFKYRNFLSDLTGIHLPAPASIAWTIPLGISFYTFEAISAVLDLSRTKQSLGGIRWPLFILFFPHAIAGPIMRYRQLAPQFDAPKRFVWLNFSKGLHLFAVGFGKKLLADPIGQIIDPVWANPVHATPFVLASALVGFSAQLFLDFSGYTDMGRGLARILGYRMPVNFRAPMFAVTAADFYQRWHVSLSAWIRTFVFDKLAMAVMRRIRSRKVQNYVLLVVVLLVMALFGLWHGSAWHFVMFGVLQGVVIAGFAAVLGGKAPRTLWGRFFSLMILQLSWLLSLLWFRADTMQIGWSFMTGLIGNGAFAYPDMGWCWAGLLVAWLIQLVDFHVRNRHVAHVLRFLRTRIGGLLIVSTAMVGLFTYKVVKDSAQFGAILSGEVMPSAGFIYFNF